MQKTNFSFLIHGMINIVIHIPAMFATSFWGLFIIGIFDLWGGLSSFAQAIIMLPILIPLISCIVGIIRGAVFIKRDQYAKTCLLLSLLGIFLYAGMIVLCGWIGSVA